MIGLIKRIIGVSGKYKGGIYGAFVMSFLKGMLMKEARLTVMNSCMDRIEALFAEKELDDSGNETITDTSLPEIEYKNVTFAYDTKKDVLKDVSFKAQKGEMIALVGPSGGGKSTIASLLTRFWDVKSGTILAPTGWNSISSPVR